MHATMLLIHRISVSIFVLSYVIRLIGILGNIQAIQALYSKKIMRVLVDMVVSTLFLLTGVWLLLNMPSTMISSLLIIKVVLVLLSVPVAVIGFKKSKKALAILSVLMIVASYGLGEMNHRKPSVDKSILKSAVNPEEVFVGAKCVACHGVNGANPVGEAKNLSQSKQSVDEIRHSILKGKNSMPAYKSSLTPEQLDQLVVYVKSLQK